MKVLVVDDSSVTRRIAVNTLRTLGVESILEAADGKTALQLCDRTVDLVLTDWNMPTMGGLDLVRALRSHPELGEIPVLLVTARQVREDVVEAAQAGVQGYVIKPFTPEVLRDRIQEVMARTRERSHAAPDGTNDDVDAAPGHGPDVTGPPAGNAAESEAA